MKWAVFIAENYQANYNVGVRKALSRTLEALGIKKEMQDEWYCYRYRMDYSDIRYYELVNDDSHDTMTKVYLVFWDFSDLPF